MQDELKSVFLPSEFEIDESFDSKKFIKLRVKMCHDGANPNGSAFKVVNLEKAAPSSQNIPMLAHVVFDDAGQPQFGGHDMHIEEHVIHEGKKKIIYDEIAVGTVPESNNYQIVKEDGRHYVYVDAYIWKGYSNYAEDIVIRDGQVKVSMEIEVDGYKYDKKTKLYEITDFRYKGITMLGNDKQTGMIGANAQMVQYDKTDAIQAKFEALMDELKAEIERCQSLNCSGDINNLTDKEGESLENVNENKDFEAEKIAAEPAVEGAEEAKQFEGEEGAEDTAAETAEGENADAGDEGESKEEGEDKKDSQFELNNNLSSQIYDALDEVKVETEWGERRKYMLADFDIQASEVYCYDTEDWKIYGFSFSMNGDRVVIDFESKKRKKFAIVDFDNGVTEEFSCSIGSAVEGIVSGAVASKNAELSAVKAEFEEYKTNHSTDNTEVAKLQEFKQGKLAEDHKEQVQSVLAEFEDLSENEEYISIADKALEFEDMDLLRKELFAVRGKMATTAFAAKPKSSKGVNLKIGIAQNESKDEPYGGIFSHFGIKKQ